MDDTITIEECITRLDAIRHEIVANSRDHFALSAGIAALYEMEKNAPAVNRWIPVEDDLPENRVNVIFTINRGTPRIGCGYRIHSDRGGLLLTRWFDKLSGLNFSDYDVKAWMPMPDAYEPPEKE